MDCPLPGDLLARVRELTRTHGDRPDALVQALTAYLQAHPVTLEQLPDELKVGHPDHYARHRLHACPETEFVAYLMVWQPGQRTPVHDHDGAWGVIGCLGGELSVTDYERTDDGAVPGKAQLEEIGYVVLQARQAGQTWFPDREIHELANESDAPAYSLHLYARDITDFLAFDVEAGTVEQRRLQPTSSAA